MYVLPWCFQMLSFPLIQIRCVLAWLADWLADPNQVCSCLVGMKTCSHSPLLDQFDTTGLVALLQLCESLCWLSKISDMPEIHLTVRWSL